jgi:hypothetical protein
MGKKDYKSKYKKSNVEKGFGTNNGDADTGIENDNREEKTELLRKLASLNSELSRLTMDNSETEDSIIHELMRLSGLIAQLRMLDQHLLPENIESDFDRLFDEYLKKYPRQ